MPVDDKIQQLIHDLSQAVARAVTASPEAAEAIRESQREGHSFYLVLDRGGEEIRIPIERRDPTSAVKPGFRLKKDDVSFLESVGIDATRSSRRRRTS